MQETIKLEMILSLLRQKYQQLDGFMNATQEMHKLADGEDADAFGIYLDMRENNMKRIGQIDAQVKAESGKLPKGLAKQLAVAMAGDGPAQYDLPELARIHEADVKNRALHARIVQADEVLNAMIGNITPQEQPEKP